EAVSVRAFGEEYIGYIPLPSSKDTVSAQLIIEGRNLYRNSTIAFDNTFIDATDTARVLSSRRRWPGLLLHRAKWPPNRLYVPIKVAADTEAKRKALGGARVMHVQNAHSPTTSEIINIGPMVSKNLDSSFIHVSAIKSVSGIKPTMEFFDIQFRIKQTDWLSELASIDIALTADTVAGKGKHKITDAMLSFNLEWSRWFKDWWITKDNQRALYIGGIMKIFDGITYYGGVIGGVEIKQSPLQSSYFYMAYLSSLYPDNASKDNLFLEVRLHSDRSDFFRTFAIKGGFLFPNPLGKSKTHDDIKTRIVLEIPIGKVTNF
ncbi:MAG: hypothetical protein ACYTBP_17535, partial [Planctomycetota bacterium]